MTGNEPQWGMSMVQDKRQKMQAEPTKDAERPKQRKPRDARWKQILDAAAAIFHEKGYSATTLQDIADRVGILKGSIYYYIKTKPDLLESLLVQVHEEGLTMVLESAAVPGHTLDRLASVIRAYVTYIVNNRVKSAVYIHEVQRLPPAHRNKILRDHQLRTAVQALVERGQEEGLIRRAIDPRLTTQILLSGLNSIYQWYRPEKDRPKEVLIDHMVDVTLRGIASPQGLKSLADTDPIER